jgi:tetratricopeptide (TPR) repeat protein
MTDKHSDDLRHVSGCRECRERFVADNVVPFPAGDETRAERRRQLFDTARKLQQEKEASAGVVARHLRATPSEEWPRLAEVAELRNSAALEQMSEEVHRLLDREPVNGLAVANLATVIAESLPPSAYPETILAQLRAKAWKDRAHALRYLARYPEAMDAIAKAEERLAPHAALAYDRAIVRLVKAMVMHQTGAREEAHAILRNCHAVFESYGDQTRSDMASMIEANFFYDGGRYDDARAVFAKLLESARSAGDVERQAGLHSNLGYCDIHLLNYASANIQFSEAIAKFNDLGFTSAALRTQRGAGALLISKGQTRSGIAHLKAVREQYLKLQMIQDAGLCGLEIVESLVDRGDVEEARALAREIASEFAAAEMDSYAVRAVARLDEAIAAGGTETVLQVRNVSAFIRGLDPTRDYVR